MATKKQFEATLDTLAEYIVDLGDEIVARDVDDLISMTIGDEEYDLVGHRCRDRDSIYLVGGHPDTRPMVVIYLLSLSRNIGSSLEETIATELAKEHEDYEEGDEPDVPYLAGEVMLNKLPREKVEALTTYAYLFTSGGNHDTFIFRNEADVITGFNTNKLFFPFEDSFGIREFYETLQPVVTYGRRGNRVLSRAVVVEVNEDDPIETEIDINLGW